MKMRIINSLFTLLAILLFSQHLNAEMTNVVHETVLSKFEPVLLNELDDERGRGGVVDVTTLNKMRVTGVVADNVATDNITGSNIIDNDSFAGFQGFNSVIQNTGNNVLIQNATILTVTFTP